MSNVYCTICESACQIHEQPTGREPAIPDRRPEVRKVIVVECLRIATTLTAGRKHGPKHPSIARSLDARQSRAGGDPGARRLLVGLRVLRLFAGQQCGVAVARLV